MKSIFTAIILICLSLLFSTNLKAQCDPDWMWWKGSTQSGIDMEANGMVIDKNDNVYVTAWVHNGNFKFDSLSCGSPTFSGVLVKFNRNGKTVWTKTIGNGWGKVNGIVIDNTDHIYIAGTYGDNPVTFGKFTLSSYGYKSDNVFVAKYDTNGNVLWAKRSGGTQPGSPLWVYAVSIDGKANIVITGSTCGLYYILGNDSINHNPHTPGNNDGDIFVVKYDSSGNPLWGLIPKSPNGISETPQTIYCDNAGNIYLSGQFSKSIDFDSIHLTYQGSMFFTKYNPNGKAIWAKTLKIRPIPFSYEAFFWDIKVDSVGNIFISGDFGLMNGDTIYFDTIRMIQPMNDMAERGMLLKLDSNGKVKWLDYTQGTSQMPLQTYKINLDKEGNIYQTCETSTDSIYFSCTNKWYKLFDAPSGSNLPVVIYKYNTQGKLEWLKPTLHGTTYKNYNDPIHRLGGDFLPSGGINFDSHGNIVFFGSYSSYIIFNGDTLLSPLMSNGNLTETPILVKMRNPLDTKVITYIPTCNGDNSGKIEIQPFGGTPTYRYLWSTGQNTPVISGISGGAYTVKIMDTNNCSVSDTIFLSQPSAMAISFSTKNETDNNHNGEATAFVSGGTAPYIFKWSDPLHQSTAKASGLSSGNYSLTVTDKNGCKKDTAIIINRTLAINSILFSQIKVYPNPVAGGKLIVEVPITKEKVFFLYLSDAKGNIVFNKKCQSPVKDQIDTSKFKPGVYQLRIVIGESVFTKDIIIN